MNDVPMNPDNAPLTPCLIHGSAWCTCRREVSLPSNEVRNPEAPPTGPVLSAEQIRNVCRLGSDISLWQVCDSHEALRAALTQRDARVAELEREVDYQKSRYEGMVSDRNDWRNRCDKAQGILASTGDLLNSWARESGVQEAKNDLGVHALADRLWSSSSLEWDSLRRERDAARQRISDLEDAAARLEGRMGTALNRIRVLEAEQDVLLEGLSSCVRQLENYNQEPVEAYKQAVVAAQALLGKGDAKS